MTIVFLIKQTKIPGMGGNSSKLLGRLCRGLIQGAHDRLRPMRMTLGAAMEGWRG
jgi:hypothetical protein